MQSLINRRKAALQAFKRAKEEAFNTRFLVDQAIAEKTEKAIIEALREGCPKDHLKLDLNATLYQSGNSKLENLAKDQQDLNDQLTIILGKIDSGRFKIFRALSNECLLSPRFISGHKKVNRATILREFTE